MSLQSTAPLLFASSDNLAVQQDPANHDWVALVRALEGARCELLARRYYQALYHFRNRRRRPALPGLTEITAPNRQGALQGILAAMEQRKVDRKGGNAGPADVLVDPRPDLADDAYQDNRAAVSGFGQRTAGGPAPQARAAAVVPGGQAHPGRARHLRPGHRASGRSADRDLITRRDGP
jgi:hypothetical protein